MLWLSILSLAGCGSAAESGTKSATAADAGDGGVLVADGITATDPTVSDSDTAAADATAAPESGADAALDDSTAPATRDATPSDASCTVTKSPLGKYVVTWYSFQDNTPVNSSLSASGRELIPYVSVAVPFRLLKAFGGSLDYGDKLYIEFLDGRAMPNGKKHSGWVQIDDFCGDSGDDSYCFQTVSGTKYPNTDLYIGDFTKSGMDPSACTGPAGSGQELTNVSTGAPCDAWSADYGGRALGTGTCGDEPSAQARQSGCWNYTPPASSASMCSGCTHTSCAGH